ncbi:ABC transporter ATP-binding protein [Leucobacter luti]|uniref:Amino acid/amide ABC transporter ATP-binding protein 2 (HAAT family) n=1 Tax=Leucobacter luti TaxID=340320 RepID=A0A4Q7U8A7_9MICO|nr:ABC transporter ATP-binding protein [Leucobacter luti]MBL3700562.1 ABC transporter ATP-binding protein [Leucobacter luti]RZT68602.1 amino acid/amide ABC transporter ATP-binding protein 2 (HAAT family) [Leucobacter luti]
MLELTDVVAGYGSTVIVQGITLGVATGECAALVGPNGHGKTTLLRAISGLLRVRSGSIRFDGTDITKLKAEKIVELGLIHMPQGDLVFPDMTVEENLVLGAFTRTAAKRSRERIAEVYDIFPRLLERRGQRARTLSGGERRMLAIGRGLMGDARLIMIDEPSLGLAPVIVDEVYHQIRRIVDTGMTVLLVEENINRARSLARDIHLVENGTVVRSGRGSELLDDRAIRETYLGVSE